MEIQGFGRPAAIVRIFLLDSSVKHMKDTLHTALVLAIVFYISSYFINIGIVLYLCVTCQNKPDTLCVVRITVLLDPHL